MAAYIANKLGFVVIERQQLSDAENAYKEVLDKLPARRFCISRADRRLREEVRAGRDRVKRAQADQYDEPWLMV